MCRLAIAAIFIFASAAVAQAQALGDTSGLSCGQFKKSKDGTWRAKGWMILPCGVALSPGTPFIEGANLCGRDLASELDDACGG
ncbi:hypothetical protein [Methylocystis parvus]|uniref:DUF2282 domain-containing protein n=1 Tax=Methylocystis parvus TaxID=134 RepID=A0A6B8MA35_9HYPH|nr:hypothetical protein [Methylocystis parvus]QGM98153.1 hypothetical protein F7D14_12145 [Methylocystis parvus]WBK01526.1 hypothetical protein MMG94_07430 [Methylocystis parvus OBBP]